MRGKQISNRIIIKIINVDPKIRVLESGLIYNNALLEDQRQQRAFVVALAVDSNYRRSGKSRGFGYRNDDISSISGDEHKGDN